MLDNGFSPLQQKLYESALLIEELAKKPAVSAAPINLETTLVFNKTLIPIVGEASHNTWLEFQPLEKQQGSLPFAFTQTSTKYGDWQPNEVVMMGFNMAPGGGPIELGKPGIGLSFEQHYKPSGPGLGLTEHHTFWITPQGKQVRLESFTVNNQINDVDYYQTVHRTYQKSPTTDVVYHGRLIGGNQEVIEYYSGEGFNYQWQYDAQGVQLSCQTGNQPIFFRGPLFVEMPSAIFHKSYIEFSNQLIVSHNASFNYQLKNKGVDLLAEIIVLKEKVQQLENKFGRL